MNIISIIICTVIISLVISLLIYYIKNKNSQKDHKKLMELFSQLYSNKDSIINKIVYPIRYINLDRSPERKKYIENQFRIHNIKNYKRIKGIDGKKLSTTDIKFVNEYTELNKNEIACTLSHLKCIEDSFHSDDEISVIIEDDCFLGLMPYWSKTLPEIVQNAPDDWEILQLFGVTYLPKPNWSNNYNYKDYTYIPNTIKNDVYGAVGYIINKKGMSKILEFTGTNPYYLHKINSQQPKKSGVADIYLYRIAKTYVISPILILPINIGDGMGSTIWETEYKKINMINNTIIKYINQEVYDYQY